MVQKIRVMKGQRYAQRLSMQQRTAVWKVGSILSSTAHIPHARLINVQDPLRTKTISCTTRVDRVYYQLVAESATRSAERTPATAVTALGGTSNQIGKL